MFKFTKTYKRQQQLIAALHEFTESVIKARRLQLKNIKPDSKNENSDIGQKKKKGLLDLLLETTVDGSYLSDNDIREEIDTFMFEV